MNTDYATTTSVPTFDDSSNAKSMSSVVIGLLMLSVGIMGVFGNTTSVILFARPEMRSPVTILLLGVSFADLMLIVLCICTFVVQNITIYVESTNIEIYIILSTVSVYPLMHVAQTISLWLLVLITIERYIAVAHPFVASRLMNCRRALYALLMITAGAIAYNAVRFMEWQISWRTITTNTTDSYGQTVVTVKYYPDIIPNLRQQPSYFQIYFTALYFTTQFAIPLLFLLILNARIAFLVRKAQVERRSLSNTQQSEHRVAIMMLVLIGMFLLCRTTPCILNIVEAVKTDLFVNDATINLAYLLTDISNVLVILNLSTTWLIYYHFNRRYRYRFRQIYCCQKKRYQGNSMNSVVSMDRLNTHRRSSTYSVSLFRENIRKSSMLSKRSYNGELSSLVTRKGGSSRTITPPSSRSCASWHEDGLIEECNRPHFEQFLTVPQIVSFEAASNGL